MKRPIQKPLKFSSEPADDDSTILYGNVYFGDTTVSNFEITIEYDDNNTTFYSDESIYPVTLPMKIIQTDSNGYYCAYFNFNFDTSLNPVLLRKYYDPYYSEEFGEGGWSLVNGEVDHRHDLNLKRKIAITSPSDGSEVGSKNITFSWESIDEAYDYTLSVYKASDFTNVYYESHIASASISVYIDDLENSTEYLWSISAYTELYNIVGDNVLNSFISNY